MADDQRGDTAHLQQSPAHRDKHFHSCQRGGGDDDNTCKYPGWGGICSAGCNSRAKKLGNAIISNKNTNHEMTTKWQRFNVPLHEVLISFSSQKFSISLIFFFLKKSQLQKNVILLSTSPQHYDTIIYMEH